MNLYLDASAIVKRYLEELGTPEVIQIIEHTTVQGTSIISRAEVSAALAKTVRVGLLKREQARSVLETFRHHWAYFSQLQLTETVIARADWLAFEQDLRGYDAVQLASALTWAEGLNETVIFATFDLRLWEAAATHPPLECFPNDLPTLLNHWKREPGSTA